MPMMIYTITPFFGPVVGPVLGGFLNYFTTWRWTFYVLSIWTGVILTCLIFVPETYHPVLHTRKATALRASTGNSAYQSASELAKRSNFLSTKIVQSLYRPFQLLFLEPMSLYLCLYSSLLVGVLYLFFGAFPLVFRTNHGFNLWQTCLTFLGLCIGIAIRALTNPFWFKNNLRLVTKFHVENPSKVGEKPGNPDPELRLLPTIAGSVLVPIGLFCRYLQPLFPRNC